LDFSHGPVSRAARGCKNLARRGQDRPRARGTTRRCLDAVFAENLARARSAPSTTHHAAGIHHRFPGGTNDFLSRQVPRVLATSLRDGSAQRAARPNRSVFIQRAHGAQRVSAGPARDRSRGALRRIPSQVRYRRAATRPDPNGTAACRARSCGDGRGRGAVPASRRPAPRVAQVASAIDRRGCAQYQTPPALAYVPARCIRCPQACHQSCRVLPGLPWSTIRPRTTPCPTTTPRAPRRAAESKVCAVSDDV